MSVHSSRKNVMNSNSKKFADRVCYCCGKGNHLATTCRFKDYSCHGCGKKGHLLNVCRDKGNFKNSMRGNSFNNNNDYQNKNVKERHNYFEEEFDDDEFNNDELFNYLDEQKCNDDPDDSYHSLVDKIIIPPILIYV